MGMNNASTKMVKAQTGFGLCVFNLRQKSPNAYSCAMGKMQMGKLQTAVWRATTLFCFQLRRKKYGKSWYLNG